jgi:hypothetical protein
VAQCWVYACRCCPSDELVDLGRNGSHSAVIRELDTALRSVVDYPAVDEIVKKNDKQLCTSPSPSFCTTHGNCLGGFASMLYRCMHACMHACMHVVAAYA